MVEICCATTDSTSISIRLNSSKQAHAPALLAKAHRMLAKVKVKWNHKKQCGEWVAVVETHERRAASVSG